MMMQRRRADLARRDDQAGTDRIWGYRDRGRISTHVRGVIAKWGITFHKQEEIILKFAHTIFKFHHVASCAVCLLHSSLCPCAADGVLGKDEAAWVVDAIEVSVSAGSGQLFHSLTPGPDGGGRVDGVEGGLEGQQE